MNNKLKILICTGIFPPDVGGPAQYAKNLAIELSKRNLNVKVLAYTIEKKLPTGIRHCFYFLKIILNIWKTDLIIALDTFSVGFPTVLATKIFRKKIIIRTGGDFLWENYVEITGNLILIKEFYEKFFNNKLKLSLKLKATFLLLKFVLKNCSALIFSTDYQRKIFIKAYGLNFKKTHLVENFYGKKLSSEPCRKKNYLWAGRFIKWKNLNMLKSVFVEARKVNNDIKLEISENIFHDELIKKIQNCYAVIYPSLDEISPNFILEAIRCNKPFILTKYTGLYNKLKDIGIFIDPRDEQNIKNKILFLADEKNYNEYKNKIENFTFTHSWQKIVDEFLSIYKNL